MKKFYSFVVIAILGMIGFAANAAEYTVTLNIDNPDHVYLEKGWGTYVDLVAGDNTLVLDPANSSLYYTLSAKDDCYISDVVAVNGNNEPIADLYWSNTSVYIQQSNVPAGSVITVTTGSYSEGRTATATLKVDKASDIVLTYEGSYYNPEIVSGTNTLSFNPTAESTWRITTVNYEPAYSVTHNGTEIPCMYGYFYSIPDVADGDVIDVQIDFPELQAQVNVTYPAGMSDIIGGVKLNDEWVSDWDGGFSATTGDKVKVYVNNLTYTNLSASVNGEPTYLYGSLDVSVNKEVMTIDITGEVDAEAQDVTLVLDDASAVIVCAGNSDGFILTGMHTGSNTIKMRNYTTLDITATEGNMITKATRTDDSGNTNIDIYGMTNVMLNYQTDYGTCTYTIETGDLDALRTAQVTVTVDDPAKVEFRMNTGVRTLVAGENTLKFMPEEESEVSIMAKGNGDLYNVSLNGNDLEAQYGAYNFDITNGDAIDIKANFPEGTAHVSLVYPDTEGIGYITNVTLNGEDVANFNDGFDANIGDKVVVYGDYYSNYVLVSFQVNGVDVTNEFWGQYEVVVRGDTQISIDAHLARTVQATLVVDNANNVEAYYFDDSWTRQYITLADGANNFTINEIFNPLTISATTNAKLTSVKVDGVAQLVQAGWDGVQFCEVTVREGSLIEVVTGEDVREADQDLVIYVSEGAYSYVSIQDKDQINEVYFEFFEDGKTEGSYIESTFAPEDNPLTMNIGTSDGSAVYVYLNNEPVESSNPNYFTQQVTVSNNDVLKIYNYQPATCAVTFDVQNAEGFEVKMDLNTAVDAASSLNVLQGTIITVSGENITVSADGEPIDETDGVFAVEVKADTVITIAGKDGLANVEATRTLNTVYNLQGVMILRDATAAQVAKLPAGLYIINGKKVLVK